MLVTGISGGALGPSLNFPRFMSIVRLHKVAQDGPLLRADRGACLLSACAAKIAGGIPPCAE